MTSASGRLRGSLLVVAAFVALTVIMTWPQARVLADRATPHPDVYFNLWRLEWLGHALVTHPTHILDANIFYPEPRTLTLSDAMPVEGLLAGPLFLSGLPPVLVHNVLLLGAIALSGVAMFALVTHLTGSRGAALVAGFVFAFAPYRFEHVMHMELQWTMWVPLAFLALHRTLESGRIRTGVTMGLLTALQMLSSIYYGVFLATLLGLCGILLLIARHGAKRAGRPDAAVPLRRAVASFGAGALVAASISAAYAVPYLRTRAAVGDRAEAEIAAYSARPSSYLVATPTNWIYGRMLQTRGRSERRLFPGVAVVLLAMVGLLLKPPSTHAIVYLLALVAAFETSLGFGGYAYRFLYEHTSVYRALRAPARLGIFVVMFLAILGGFGYANLARELRATGRRALLAALIAAFLVEYRVTLDLVPYPNSAPPLYRYLAELPRGVVAELPVPVASALPGPDPEYAYMSTFHWFPLVNGYSGVYPPSYLNRLAALRNFPDSASIAQLRDDSVRYVIVHASGYSAAEYPRILGELERVFALRHLGVFADGRGDAHLFAMR